MRTASVMCPRRSLIAKRRGRLQTPDLPRRLQRGSEADSHRHQGEDGDLPEREVEPDVPPEEVGEGLVHPERAERRSHEAGQQQAEAPEDDALDEDHPLELPAPDADGARHAELANALN